MSENVKVLLARNAMATRFELVLFGEDERYLRAAGEEALEEIERIESRISPFRPSSEITLINQRAFEHPVRVSFQVFELLKTAKKLWEQTEGAFDITIGQLMQLWGFRGEKSQSPIHEIIEKTRSHCGMNFVELDDESHSVRFLNENIQIDLGAIGKGFAIERAIELLREAGVTSGLLHGGTSTIAAIGSPPESDCWQVSIEIPPLFNERTEKMLGVARLADCSLSVSAIWGRILETGEKTYGHIIDPRTGQPSDNNILAAVSCNSATYSDALSTALLVAGKDLYRNLVKIYPDLKCLIAEKQKETEALTIYYNGIEPSSSSQNVILMYLRI